MGLKGVFCLKKLCISSITTNFFFLNLVWIVVPLLLNGATSSEHCAVIPVPSYPGWDSYEFGHVALLQAQPSRRQSPVAKLFASS